MSISAKRAQEFLDSRTPQAWPNYPDDLPTEWSVHYYRGERGYQARIWLNTPHGVSVNGDSSTTIAMVEFAGDAALMVAAPELATTVVEQAMEIARLRSKI